MTSVTVIVKVLLAPALAVAPVFASAAESITEAVTSVAPIGNVDPEVTVSAPPTPPMSAV